MRREIPCGAAICPQDVRWRTESNTKKYRRNQGQASEKSCLNSGFFPSYQILFHKHENPEGIN